MRKIYLCILIYIGFTLIADNWKELIPVFTEKDMARLEEKGYAERARVDYRDGLELLPKESGLEEDFYKELTEFNPELCVELLFVLDKPFVNGDLMVYLMNEFRALSKQSGMEYFSYNRGKMYPLIEKSYYIDEDNDKIADPVETELPKYQEHRYFQDDTTFGANKYSLITRSSDKAVWFQMENLENLRVFKVFKAINKGEERISFIIQEAEDKILLYALAQIVEEPEVKQVLKWKVNIPGSFKRRMSTIVEWYRGVVNN